MKDILIADDVLTNFLLLWFPVLFITIFLRYILFAKLYDVLVNYVQKFRSWQARILRSQKVPVSQLKKEIYYSAISSVIFAVVGGFLILLWHQGRTALYHDWDAKPAYWIVLGPLLFLLAQETYYYWIHRWMHRPKVYRWIHQRHHDSVETSAWTAFSFHPIESIIQAIFLPIAAMIIPMQEYLFFALLGFMTLSATINHAGLEIFPRWFLRLRPFSWFIGATHHDLHHRRFLCNYGLYFTFWDHWMGTESKEYKERLERMG